uniref:Uncharacterized protein n=1 Tax=Heterorhabditis bacteriophora TaxID=37862 RepID=A0A1I7XF32_HETBA
MLVDDAYPEGGRTGIERDNCAKEQRFNESDAPESSSTLLLHTVSLKFRQYNIGYRNISNGEAADEGNTFCMLQGAKKKPISVAN